MLLENQIMERAYKAYFRGDSFVKPQPANTSRVVECKGRTYAVLENVNGLLAVYSVGERGLRSTSICRLSEKTKEELLNL